MVLGDAFQMPNLLKVIQERAPVQSPITGNYC